MRQRAPFNDPNRHALDAESTSRIAYASHNLIVTLDILFASMVNAEPLLFHHDTPFETQWLYWLLIRRAQFVLQLHGATDIAGICWNPETPILPVQIRNLQASFRERAQVGHAHPSELVRMPDCYAVEERGGLLPHMLPKDLYTLNNEPIKLPISFPQQATMQAQHQWKDYSHRVEKD